MIDAEKGEVQIDYYFSSKYEPRWGYIRVKPKKIYKNFFLHISKPSKIFANHLETTPLIIEDETYLDMDLLYDLIKADLVEKI